MNFKRHGNKKDEILVNVINQDQSTNGTNGIGPGVPLILQQAGPAITNQVGGDGLGVILPSSSGGAAQVNTQLYGVNTATMGFNQLGQSMIEGYYPSAVVVLQTRAASTTSFAATTLTPWALLSVDTVNNAFAVSATNSNPYNVPNVCLLGALTQTGTASNATATTNTNTFSGLASNASDTRTALTTMARVQIRNL